LNPIDRIPDLPLRAALATLPPVERYALSLTYFERETQQQIADRLTVSTATISRAVSRALRLLAQRLDAAA
jgi:RNA polymerase sigma factor (sigma-70 family)